MTETWLGIGSVSQPCSASDTPAITLAAILATGMPVAFETNGTVRLARGLTSSTYTILPAVFLLDGELDVHQPADAQLAGQRVRGFANLGRAIGPCRLYGGIAQAESPEWMPASSMCSMTPADDRLLAVADGVDVDLDGVFEELVDQHRLALGDDDGLGHVALELRLVVADLHRPAAQHEAGPHQHRDSRSWPPRRGPAAIVRAMPLAGCLQAQPLEHLLELLAVLGVFDRLDAGADDRHAGRWPAPGPGSAASARRTARSRRRAARGRKC